MSETNRITLDWDNISLRDAMQRLNTVLGVARLNKDLYYSHTECWNSPSGKGFHIIMHLKKWITYKTQLKFRKEWQDCTKRLKFSKRDLKKGYNPDVLFTHKKIKGKWREEKWT
tara:strand:- start:624 stop:965 length:342 start_codon:yes stop_codon:yes gene_type:complete